MTWLLIILWLAPAAVLLVGWTVYRSFTRSPEEERQDRVQEAAHWAKVARRPHRRAIEPTTPTANRPATDALKRHRNESQPLR